MKAKKLHRTENINILYSNFYNANWVGEGVNKNMRELLG